MSQPQAYAPESGYRYQLLCRNRSYSAAYEHCDYAADRQERDHLRREYALAYGPGWEFKSIMLPRKYWPAPAVMS